MVDERKIELVETIGSAPKALIDHNVIGELRLKALKLIVPVDDNVFIVLDDFATKTKGGVQLPDEHSEILAKINEEEE